MNTTNSLSNTSLLYNRGGYSIKNDSVAISANRFQMLKSALIKLMLVMGMVGLGNLANAQEVTGTINFGSASGYTNVNSANVTGDDNLGNTWTITTVGTTSFTPNSSYAQIGSSKYPATSITFTTTLPSSQTITSMSAKFGGFSSTAGTITLKVGSTSVGTGSLNGTSDVIVNSSSTATGTTLTVTVTGISKGVKVYYISYTYEVPTHNVSWSVNGVTSTVNTSMLTESDIPNPTSSDCDEAKVFVGWTTSPMDDTNDAPSPWYLSSSLVGTPINADITYYAVFATVREGLSDYYAIYSGSLTEGDYIIFYSGKAMKNTVSSNRLQYEEKNPLNGIITNTNNTIIWHIAPSDSYWTIYNADVNKYVASTNTNNQAQMLSSGTESKSLWTVSGTSTYNFVNKYSTDNNKNAYLRNNGTYGFACYAASTGSALSLYKRLPNYSFSTFCPCDYDIDISNNDMVWAGKNELENDWSNASNWVVYHTSDSKYHLTATAPTSSNNVYIIEKAECEIDALPHINENTTCNNLTMFNGLGIDIAENQTLTINGTATFTNGVINGNVTFGSSATVSGASTSSHVDGVVTKSGSANGFTFPTGSNGNLGKVVVTDGSATNVSVQYFCNPTGFGTNDLPRWWNAADMSGENPFNHVSNVEYWKISSNEAITANFVAEASTDMHFNSETAEEDRIPANIQMAFYDNNRWTNVGGLASISDNTLKITGAEIPANATRGISGNYTTFGSKSKSTVLPIELVSFTANCNGRSALIEWTTATEKNNDFFVLERSNDAVNFKEIARIAGAGNSIEPISYAYTDFGVRNGDNYYRLVQVDYDGTSTASEIIVANCLGTDGEPEVLAYPNPFGDDLTLRFENFGNIQATVEVYDMLGRMVHTQKVNCSQNDYEVVLRLAGLSDGTYNLRISAKEFVLNRQVIKN